jgi:hypothetical protein
MMMPQRAQHFAGAVRLAGVAGVAGAAGAPLVFVFVGVAVLMSVDSSRAS